MSERADKVWQSPKVVENFLEGIRGAVPCAEEQIAIMMEVVAAFAKPPESFLDLGCGAGILGAAVHERYPEARGVFLDFSEPMLEAAKENFPTKSGLEFVLADYATPDWRDSVDDFGPFDLLVSGYSIHHQPDSRKRELYAEILGMLNPGGLFVNVEHVAPTSALGRRLFDDHIIESLYAVERDSGGARSREHIAMEFHNREDKEANVLAPVETQCSWLRELGYVDVDCFFRVYEIAVFAGRRPD